MTVSAKRASLPPDYLMSALGRLPENRKAEFIQDVQLILNRVKNAHEGRQPEPTEVEREVLRDVGEQCARLIKTIGRTKRHKSTSYLIKEAWVELDRITGVTVDPADPLPVLIRLQKASEFWEQEPNSAHRPVKKSPASWVAITLIAHDFRRHFGMDPTFGNNSPFVKFVRGAFSKYGVDLPSLAEIQKIASKV